MDDKTKNDQQDPNEDKDELELFTRNTSKKRRQRKRSEATRLFDQNAKDTSQQAEFDEDIYLINKDFKKDNNDNSENYQSHEHISDGDADHDRSSNSINQVYNSNQEDVRSNNPVDNGVSSYDENSNDENHQNDDVNSKDKVDVSEVNDDKGKRKSKVTQLKPLTLEEKRKLRRKRQKRIQYSIITILVLLIAVILIYMFSPLSKIAHVNINGNNHVSTSKINKILNVKSDSRMYTFSKKNAINDLEEDPLIKNVDIHKKLPNTLNVDITENEIIALVKYKGKYLPLLESGKLLKDSNDVKINDAPVMDGFSGTKENDMIKALSDMKPEVRRYIAEVSYAPSKNKQSRIELYTTDGLQVVGDISTIADKMKYYPQMSQSLSRDSSGKLKTRGYIDLSVGASFIPYRGNTSNQSESDKNVTKSSQEENQAKEELQSVLNKINNQSSKNN
ncbi:cell division protein FtsQ/DivIB [Staphylococcus sp. 30400_3112M30941]|nr:cell division protein FtsQ/DivIB [Staphylococcus sp. 30403_3112M30944]MBO0945947.1 cell division protein FtsQ/DivIB [Staphylococcus sp. 30402_3112M30943]MBO0963303.1 cell division protein FtsQ/DivIB [Staphylococcus sp. 30400_3112M30941]MBO0966469.1 cell division protein FtsQ/DivIB [Staphylococcus sp. 30401_3112M30942]